MPEATCAVCVKFTIKPEFFEQFLSAVKQQAANSKRLESWCHQFDVSLSPDQPNCVLLYETYDDHNAFVEKHRTTAHFADFSKKISEWVVSKEIGVGTSSQPIHKPSDYSPTQTQRDTVAPLSSMTVVEAVLPSAVNDSQTCNTSLPVGTGPPASAKGVSKSPIVNINP